MASFGNLIKQRLEALDDFIPVFFTPRLPAESVYPCALVTLQSAGVANSRIGPGLVGRHGVEITGGITITYPRDYTFLDPEEQAWKAHLALHRSRFTDLAQDAQSVWNGYIITSPPTFGEVDGFPAVSVAFTIHANLEAI